MLEIDTGALGIEGEIDHSPQGKYCVEEPSLIKLHIAETEVTAQYSDPLPGLLPWCLLHVYRLWAESEHATRLVHVREANGPVGHGPSIHK